jgi:TolB protein
MKTTAKIFTTLLLAIIVVSCKKDKPIPIEQPCPGGCGTVDFNVIDYQPAWSPNGKHIAYYHIDKEIDKNGIYLITPDGKENRLWHAAVGAETPTWSPDGQWIAFSMGAQIWKKKLNGDSLSQLTNTGRNFFPAWSPDGEWIAFSQSVCNAIPCGVWVVNVETKKTAFLVGFGGFPFWKSNTMNILYSTTIVQSNGNVLGDSLWVFNKNTMQKTPLIALTGINYKNNYFKYHNTGKITFTSQQLNVDIIPQIWIMNADGTNKKQLTQTGGYTSDWSNEGSKIVYTDTRAINGRLWLMNADGTNKKQLTF